LKIHTLLIDTCVWLDLAKDTNSKPLIMVLKTLIENGTIQILLPTIVKEEFIRNKDRVIDIGKQKLSQDIKKVKSVIQQYSDNSNKDMIVNGLDDVKHKLPMMTDAIAEQAESIFEIISLSEEIDITDSVKIKASERALNKKAPFHKNKNSMADALILELFFEQSLLKEDQDFFFITHNTKDFSSESDNRLHHEDYHEYFSKNNTHYSIKLLEIINSISPDMLDELEFEFDWEEESRGFYEILDSINKLTDQIWYNRHCNRVYEIEQGNLEIVEEKDYDVSNHNQIVKYIWDGALKSAKNKESMYPDELGPWSDFEWGMLNGKLSALRWVLGEEWDMLDT